MLFPAFQPQTTGQIKKVTSSERSDSQIYRVTPRLMARSRRTPRMLILPMPFGAFQPPKPAHRILLRYPPDGHGCIFSSAVIILHPQVCVRSLNSGLMVRIRLSFFSRRQPLSCFSRAMALRRLRTNSGRRARLQPCRIALGLMRAKSLSFCFLYVRALAPEARFGI